MTDDDMNQLVLFEAEKKSLAEDTKRFERGTLMTMWALGERYKALKEKVPHGEWGKTLEEMEVSRFTAAKCQKIFEGYPELPNVPPGGTFAR